MSGCIKFYPVRAVGFTRILGGVALGLGISGAQAALIPLGGEFPLLGDLKGHQRNPHVVLGSTGGVVVWQTSTDSDSTERVMVQRLGGDMTGLGVAARVSSSSERWNEMSPQATLLTEGRSVVVWAAGPRSSTDIFYRFMDVNGNFLGVPALVNTFTNGIQCEPAVTTLSTGEVAIVWTSLDQDAQGRGVYGQIFTADGARMGGEFRVNQSEASNQSSASLVPLGRGEFVVAWVNEAVAGTTSFGAQNIRGNLMGRIFDSAGKALGSEYQLNDGQGVGFSPALANNSDGGFTLAWAQRDEENPRNLSDIYVRTFNSSGLPQAVGQRHNTWLRGQQVMPKLMQLNDETLVIWGSYGQDDSGGSIQGRLLSGGREFQVNSQGRMHQRSPSLAADGNNKFLAIWVNTVSPTHSIISGQRYVNSDGDLDDVVDITAGKVEIVSAEETRRQAAPVGQLESVLSESANVLVIPSGAQTVADSSVDSAPSNDAGDPMTPVSVSAAAPNPKQVSADGQSKNSSVRLRPPVRRSLSTRSSEAGRRVLMAAARQRVSGGRAPVTRSTPTLTQSRAEQSTAAAKDSQSYVRPNTSQESGVPSSSLARRQFQLSRDRQLVNRRFDRTYSHASRLAQARAPRPTFTSASSRFNSILNNSLYRTGTSQRLQRVSNAQPRPVATSLQRSDEGLRIQWTSRQGARYQIQGSNDLRQWANVGPARSGTGGRDSEIVDSRNNEIRYYRVVQLD